VGKPSPLRAGDVIALFYGAIGGSACAIVMVDQSRVAALGTQSKDANGRPGRSCAAAADPAERAGWPVRPGTTSQEKAGGSMFRRLTSLLAVAVAATGLLGPAGARAQEEKPYSVVDGKVDKGTYNGYRRYHSSCHTCHGPDGMGSSYAPNLVESLQRITYEDFTNVVINGRQNVTGTQKNVMPAFGLVEDVALYVDDIYAYLKARADGAIGRGRPVRQ
jgi:methanol metabolism-related c-type cytochrome